MKSTPVYTLLLMVVFYTSCGQSQRRGKKIRISPDNQGVITSHGPQVITRNIIQDKKGNIWIAAFDGIFRYDARLPNGQGKSFTNITSKVSSAHFFSVLEDKKGNFWFGSIGSGVFYYDGKSFQNFTTRDGLANNNVTCIYEDKAGNIWFGASRYDGKSFRNFTTKDGLSNNDVNAVVEDKTGKFWFATKGNIFVYDARLPDGQGRKFTIFTHNGKPFTNIRSIIEDKKGNIWLGGSDGLWRYDSKTFINLTQNFVGSICEDKKGNIWIGSASADNKSWTLSRYDEKFLADKTPAVTKTASIEGMICGAFEANDGSIWFGTGDGVHRYDGNTITNFNGKEHQEYQFLK